MEKVWKKPWHNNQMCMIEMKTYAVSFPKHWFWSSFVNLNFTLLWTNTKNTRSSSVGEPWVLRLPLTSCDLQNKESSVAVIICILRNVSVICHKLGNDRQRNAEDISLSPSLFFLNSNVNSWFSYRILSRPYFSLCNWVTQLHLSMNKTEIDLITKAEIQSKWKI